MKKLIKASLFAGLLVTLALIIFPVAAQVQAVDLAANKCNFFNIACHAGNSVNDIKRVAVFLINAVLTLIGTLAVIYLIYAGFKYMNARGNEETATAAKRGIAYAIIGIIIALGARIIITAITAQDAAGIRTGLLEPFINVALALVGTFAVIFLIYAGYRYITSQGNEEASATAKRQIAYAILGIVIALGAYTILSAVTGVDDPTAIDLDPTAVPIRTEILTPLITMALVLVGTFAVAFLIYGGYRYITSQGNEEAATTAKRQIALAIVGIIITLGATGIVTAFINTKTTTGVPILDPAAPNILKIIDPLITLARLLVGIVAIVYFIIAGYRYITAAGNEETIQKAKGQILYAILGMIVALGADLIRQSIQGFLSPVTKTTAQPSFLPIVFLITPFLAIMRQLVAFISVVLITIGGVQYILAAGDEETVARAKRTVLYSIFGLLVAIAAVFIQQAIGSFAPSGIIAPIAIPIPADVTPLRGFIRTIVNGLLSLVSVIAAIYVIYGGVSYVTAAGDEQKTATAKFRILFAIIGLIIVALAAVGVNFVTQYVPETVIM